MEGPAEVLQNEIVSCSPSLVKRDGPPQRARKCVKRDQTRFLPPAYTATFAHQHDEAVPACLQGLLANGGPPTWDANATRRAQLPLQLGGLGLRSAETTRFAAHWASWADTVPTLRDRHPDVLVVLLRQAEAFRSEPRAGCIVPNVSAALRAPSWPALLDNPPPSGQAARSYGDPLRGWQRAATACLDAKASFLILTRLRASCCYPRRALAAPAPSRCFPPPRSSACPQTACVCCCSGGCASRYPIRPGVVAVAGLWMLLGDHRAACPTAGVLGPRLAPLERAAARVCREGDARVATNVFLRDMNVD